MKLILRCLGNVIFWLGLLWSVAIINLIVYGLTVQDWDVAIAWECAEKCKLNRLLGK